MSVTRPDGTRRVDSIGWPADRPPGQTWSGGWGFGDEKVEPGVYVLVLECAAEKTEPTELIVEQSEVVAQVKTQFRFEHEGAITKSTHVPVALTVDNGSQATIQFPQRGAMMEGISLEIVRKEPASHWALFFPWEKLSHTNIMPHTYTYSWDFPEIPSVTLKPGEHFEQHFLLEDAFSFDEPGDYQVTFATAFSMLVGEKVAESSHFVPMLDLQIMRLCLLRMLCFFLTCAVPSFGCECGPPGHASQYIKEASIAFVGRVVFTNDDGSGKFIQKTLVRFEVEEAFKGLGPEMHEVWVDPGSFTSCYAEYHVGERYLVFGYGGAVLPKDSPAVSVFPGESKSKPTPPGIDLKNPPKVYSAPECSGTRLITPKEKDAVFGEVEYLRKYKERAAKEQKHS